MADWRYMHIKLDEVNKNLLAEAARRAGIESEGDRDRTGIRQQSGVISEATLGRWRDAQIIGEFASPGDREM